MCEIDDITDNFIRCDIDPESNWRCGGTVRLTIPVIAEHQELSFVRVERGRLVGRGPVRVSLIQLEQSPRLIANGHAQLFCCCCTAQIDNTKPKESERKPTLNHRFPCKMLRNSDFLSCRIIGRNLSKSILCRCLFFKCGILL